MNKKITLAAIFVSLLGLATFVSAELVIPNPLGATSTFSALLAKIVSGVGMVIGSLGTIMIIVAGILYLTSAGSTDRMTKAKTALIYAIIGIVIGVLANVLVVVIKEIIGVPPVS